MTDTKPVSAPTAEAKDHIKVPTEFVSAVIRFTVYGLVMGLLLIPFIHGWKLICGAAILGHFSAQLNKIGGGK